MRTPSYGHQRNHRRHAYDYAQKGEPGPEAVGPDGREGRLQRSQWAHEATSESVLLLPTMGGLLHLVSGDLAISHGDDPLGVPRDVSLVGDDDDGYAFLTV